MKINFIGNYGGNYVGELADEVMLTRDIEILGNKLKKVPRDIWQAYCNGYWEDQWEQLMPIKDADINIICKWNAFNEAKFITKLKEYTNQAPVFYWTWDSMGWPETGPWHLMMAKAADLHLTNEGGSLHHMWQQGVKAYYFPFDVADGDIQSLEGKEEKIYDVAFFGSCVAVGDRIPWLTEINKTHKIKFFSWNYKEWLKKGMDAEPPAYGFNFAVKVAQSKIILGFNVDDHNWGYWSNRTGKILTLGGFLLYRYTPGMELFLRDGAEYFSSIAEVNEKIKYYLEHEDERKKIAERGYQIGRDRFTSRARIKELLILMERYLKGGLNVNRR